jgi:hypothetical protein
MLRIRELLFGIFCFLLIAEFLSWWTASWPGPCLVEIEAESQQESTKHDYPKSCATFFAGSLIALSNGAEFVKTADNDKVIVAGFTAVLAFSTIGLWLATVSLQRTTNSLWEAGERQFDLARREFLTTNRPRIRFRHVWLLSELQPNTPLIGHVTCTNTGPADAVIFQYGIRFSIIGAGRMLPVPSEFQHIRTEIRLPSGVSLPFPDTVYTPTQSEEDDIRNGRARLFFTGFLIYHDGVGNIRTTAFCRVLPRPGSREDNGRLAVFEDPDYEYED